MPILLLKTQNEIYMKKSFVLFAAAAAVVLLVACGGGSSEPAATTTGETAAPKSMVADASAYDPKRGEGKFSEENTKLGALDAALATKGKAIAETKCLSCHKTTDERLVGPGWKGITTRKAPYWILNFITNPDPMIDVDPELQKQLELCLVRMPNQGLNDNEAREILEYMREIDGAK